jgi:hypothetical protein
MEPRSAPLEKNGGVSFGGSRRSEFAEPSAGLCVCVCVCAWCGLEPAAALRRGDVWAQKMTRLEVAPSHQMDGEHNRSFPALSGPTLFVKQTKRFEREAKRAAFSIPRNKC